MRTNMYGDTYCHTAGELQNVLEARKLHPVDVIGLDIDIDNGKACAEVVTEGDDTLICFLEADTEDEIRAIFEELEIEVLP